MCTVLLTSNSGQACFFFTIAAFYYGAALFAQQNSTHLLLCSMAGSRLVQESVLGLDGI